MRKGVRRSLRAGIGILLAALSMTATVRLQPTLALLTRQTTIAGNTFATASDFCSGQRTLTFLTGFEFGPTTGLGPFDGAQTAGGTPVADTIRRSGLYAAKIAKGAGGGSSLTKTTSGSTLVVRFAVLLDSLPVVGVAQVATVGTATGNAANVRYNASSRKLEVGFGTGVGASATATVQAGEWNLIDVRVTAGTNPRTIAWRVNGVTQTAVSAAEAASSITGFTIGSAVSTDVFTARYDDIAMSATGADYPIGDGRVTALLPSGSPIAGFSEGNRFNDDNSGPIDASIYTRLDDLPVSSIADYAKQMSTSSTAYVQLDLANAGDGCINGVQALAAFHSQNGGGNAANNGAIRVVDGATETVVHSGSMLSTSLVYKSAIVRSAGAVWTQSALDALVARVGYSTDVNPTPYWDAVMIEYDASSSA